MGITIPWFFKYTYSARARTYQRTCARTTNVSEYCSVASDFDRDSVSQDISVHKHDNCIFVFMKLQCRMRSENMFRGAHRRDDFARAHVHARTRTCAGGWFQESSVRKFFKADFRIFDSLFQKIGCFYVTEKTVLVIGDITTAYWDPPTGIVISIWFSCFSQNAVSGECHIRASNVTDQKWHVVTTLEFSYFIQKNKKKVRTMISLWKKCKIPRTYSARVQRVDFKIFDSKIFLNFPQRIRTESGQVSIFFENLQQVSNTDLAKLFPLLGFSNLKRYNLKWTQNNIAMVLLCRSRGTTFFV